MIKLKKEENHGLLSGVALSGVALPVPSGAQSSLVPGPRWSYMGQISVVRAGREAHSLKFKRL